MSTQPDNKKAVRSKESLLAELLICKKLGWKIGFISGGVRAFSKVKFKELLADMHKVAGEKFWLNVGSLDEEELKEYLPFIKGVVGSIETVNEELHKKVCPSKPAEPYYKMFKIAKKHNLECGMTIILGLGEDIGDYEKLKNVVEKYGITKIHFYGLNPQKGTIFENKPSPTPEYQAEWIRKTREDFSGIDIQCGIWEDRADRVALLLEAGADSISKFPALKRFNSEAAKEIEKQAKLAGREFMGSLTNLPDIDWDQETEKLNIDKDLLQKVKVKLKQYIGTMRKN